MKIQVLSDNIRPKAYDTIRVKEMGNIIELMYSEKVNNKIYIRKISDDEYIDLRTGEIKGTNKINNRGQNINSVRQSLKRLRDYINTNVVDVTKCKWITLTYKENMTDTKKLYKDFEKFNKRMKYYLSKQDYSYEYIVAMEPQGRGAWHCHLLMIFDKKAPYIKNDSKDFEEITMEKLWGNGFTKTKKLDNIDNIGAYLTAYLGDIDVDECKNLSMEELKEMKTYGLKDIEIEDDNGKKKTKSVLKGGRLHMYPPKFNLYRCSKGIKKPKICYEKEKNIQEKVNDATLTFEKTIKLNDDSKQFENIINYRYYNRIRK